LRAALDPDLVLGLEHFGSTAIPNLAAKPIIDMLVAVRSLAEARLSVIAPLRRLGYVFWAENPKTDRMFFVKGQLTVAASDAPYLSPNWCSSACSAGARRWSSLR